MNSYANFNLKVKSGQVACLLEEGVKKTDFYLFGFH